MSSSKHPPILVLTLVLYVVGAAIPIALSLVLLFTAETLAGRIFALDALVLLAFPVVIIWARSRPRWRFRLPAWMAAIFTVLFFVLRILVPKGPTVASGPV
jgi:hypothetical protein